MGIYNNRDHSKRGGEAAKKKREAQRKERGSWDARGDGDSHPRAKEPFSLGRWTIRFYMFFTPKTSRRLIKAQLLDPLSINSL